MAEHSPAAAAQLDLTKPVRRFMVAEDEDKFLAGRGQLPAPITAEFALTGYLGSLHDLTATVDARVWPDEVTPPNVLRSEIILGLASVVAWDAYQIRVGQGWNARTVDDRRAVFIDTFAQLAAHLGIEVLPSGQLAGRLPPTLDSLLAYETALGFPEFGGLEGDHARLFQRNRAALGGGAAVFGINAPPQRVAATAALTL